MTYNPGYPDVQPPSVSVLASPWSTVQSGQGLSTTYENANRGIFVHFRIPIVCVARRMWWINGATVSPTYNVEAGIYADTGAIPGVKIVTTGSVAQGTASQVQWADITDTTLAPGSYWFFLSCSDAAATFLTYTGGWVSAIRKLVKFQQASVGPGSAPATATPVTASVDNVPYVGFSTTAS